MLLTNLLLTNIILVYYLPSNIFFVICRLVIPNQILYIFFNYLPIVTDNPSHGLVVKGHVFLSSGYNVTCSNPLAIDEIQLNFVVIMYVEIFNLKIIQTLFMKSILLSLTLLYFLIELRRITITTWYGILERRKKLFTNFLGFGMTTGKIECGFRFNGDLVVNPLTTVRSTQGTTICNDNQSVWFFRRILMTWLRITTRWRCA